MLAVFFCGCSFMATFLAASLPKGQQRITFFLFMVISGAALYGALQAAYFDGFTDGNAARVVATQPK
jgi:uncharacterized membrane protein